jgi:carbamoyl-phosphate synthase small subunit
MKARREALLVLADGETFEGIAIGHEPGTGVAAGEVVFNTALSGYQEIITDPSYAGQVITFTYPHIGNYGVAADDDEARVPWCRGVVVRDLARRASNWRARDDLDGFLRRHRVAGIAGIDTRRLTRHIREAGALPGAFGTADRDTLLTAAREDGDIDALDLVREVTTSEPYTVGEATAGYYVVAYDFGIKRSILDQLVDAGCQVEVVPATTPPPTCSNANPTACSSRTGPATRPQSRARTRTCSNCSAGCRCSASASVTRSWASRSARRRSSCASVTTARTTPCRTSTRTRWRSRARTTTTRSTVRHCPTGWR